MATQEALDEAGLLITVPLDDMTADEAVGREILCRLPFYILCG